MLPLTTKDKEATFAMLLMNADSQLRKRGKETFVITPLHPTPNKVPDFKQKAIKEKGQ